MTHKTPIILLVLVAASGMFFAPGAAHAYYGALPNPSLTAYKVCDGPYDQACFIKITDYLDNESGQRYGNQYAYSNNYNSGYNSYNRYNGYYQSPYTNYAPSYPYNSYQPPYMYSQPSYNYGYHYSYPSSSYEYSHNYQYSYQNQGNPTSNYQVPGYYGY